VNGTGRTFAAIFRTALLVAVMAAGLSGCQREGPAERAGKDLDRAVEKTGQELQRAGDSIRDAAKSATQ
jgi:hypothetical protein